MQMSKPENEKLPQRKPLAAALALPPLWLGGWKMEYPVPVSRETLRKELEDWNNHCRPADPKAVAVLLERTLALYGAPENWDEIAEFYLEAFESTPLDLVEEALKEVRLTCKFFPKPSELRAPIVDEEMNRQATQGRLRMALKHGTFEDEER